MHFTRLAPTGNIRVAAHRRWRKIVEYDIEALIDNVHSISCSVKCPDCEMVHEQTMSKLKGSPSFICYCDHRIKVNARELDAVRLALIELRRKIKKPVGIFFDL